MSLPVSRRSLSGGIKRVALMHGCTLHGNSKALLDAFSLPDPISMRVSSPWPTDARGQGSPSIRRSRCYW